MNYTIPIIMSMLFASEPPQLYDPIQISRVYHHVDKDVCLGIENTIVKQEWLELPDTTDIVVHRYEVVDIQPNKILELFCVVHEKYEQIIYKTKDAK